MRLPVPFIFCKTLLAAKVGHGRGIWATLVTFETQGFYVTPTPFNADRIAFKQ